MKNALNIHVSGIVQGVGFRPFVYRLAKRYLICGWVLNTAEGVSIHAEGEEDFVEAFVLELTENAPSSAQVKQVDIEEVPLDDCEGFEIRTSERRQVGQTTLVSPDLAVCADCLQELENPADRRYHYPFINCTNCGPRFTIIDTLPYDRTRTSMAGFSMCEECRHEYLDPENRRFHAQPDACFACGPHLSWMPVGQEILWGTTPEASDEIIGYAAKLLCEGGIVAVKGLGGFHLACDAHNERAVFELRKRKHRDGKPFAVMAGSIDDVCKLCDVNKVEERLLDGVEHPIVLLRKRSGVQLAPGVADALPELGVMLPYTPLQHLLMSAFALHRDCDTPSVLVMTSGNFHDEPIVTDDTAAKEKLAGVADAFLGNDRPIRARYDDSVVRVVAMHESWAIQMIRRARGYAPQPLGLPQTDGCFGDARLLATGPEQKNTFCLVRGSEAFVSQHMGDVENADTFDAWIHTIKHYETIFQAKTSRLVCDTHPEYLTTKWAQEQSLPCMQVQHHHAHIASVLGEHKISGPVCGIAFDGTGYGTDGTIWGGEVLLANMAAFERFANFSYIPMPGGAACIKQPLRMAYGLLYAFDLLDHPGALQTLDELGDTASVLQQMIEQNINTPYTSSVGRLFDAASVLSGVCKAATYEGEPAILLEAALGDLEVDTSDSFAERYPISVVKNTAMQNSTAQDTSVVLFDAAEAFGRLLDDVASDVPTAIIARRFHDALVAAVVTAAELVRNLYDIHTVVLSGGVWMNRYLLEHAVAMLSASGFTTALNSDLPPNDGCVSYGQAVVALSASSDHETKKA